MNTPKFEEKLQEYFKTLELDEKGGQWRICRFSGEKFYVRPEDVAFYKRIGVPLPTLSPKERSRRRVAYLNVFNLFRTKSALTGKEIVALYPPSSPYKIYEHQEWFGENWDPFAFGVSYNPEKSFFEQWKDFQRAVPRPNLVSRNCVNSEYGSEIENAKDCYFVFDSMEAENCLYCSFILNSKNIVDGYAVFDSDECYECSNCDHMYRSFFCDRSFGCLDSAFLYDCKNCSFCFGCSNLRNKKYCFLNKQMDKEEYEQEMKNVNLGDREALNKWKKEYAKIKKESVYKQYNVEKSRDCVGDFIFSSKNLYACFYLRNSEDSAYCAGGEKTRDSYDLLGGIENELCYETHARFAYGAKFSLNSTHIQDSEFCDLCANVKNCFACVGLKNKSFCVFNRQYPESDYWELVDSIKNDMLQKGEYGEFFPPSAAPFPYRISAAMSFPGFEDVENADKYGYDTSDVDYSAQDVAGEVIDADKTPNDIKNADESVLLKVIRGEGSGKKFRYVARELDFLKKHNLALPAEHYYDRMTRRRISLGSVVLSFYDRVCAKCGQSIKSVIPEGSDSPAKVYCESCYNAEMA